MRFTQAYRSWPAGAIIAPNAHLSTGEIRALVRIRGLIPADQPWSPPKPDVIVETADVRPTDVETRDDATPRRHDRPRRMKDVAADLEAEKKEGDV